MIFPFSWARNFAHFGRTEVNSGSFPPTANLNVVQIRSRPKHLPLAEKTTVARRYGVSKLWLLCLHFMTRSGPKRGAPKCSWVQMHLPEKVLLPSKVSSTIQQKRDKTRQVCHPADTDKNYKNARPCPPKLSNHFLDWANAP